MKKSHLLVSTLTAIAAVGVFAITGCSGDDTVGGTPGNDSGIVGNDSGPGTDGGPGSDAGPQNPVPTLGAQIDRFGRPAINTALNHPFDTNATTKGAAKDAYNSDKGVTTWQASYTAQFAANLGILDSLDSNANPTTFCGNQFGFALAKSYAALGGILADDRLYVDTRQATCNEYLSVEINKLLSAPPSECGGRKLSYDVIASTYSDAVGIPFDDGVTAPSSAVSDTFPYLADPH